MASMLLKLATNAHQIKYIAMVRSHSLCGRYFFNNLREEHAMLNIFISL